MLALPAALPLASPAAASWPLAALPLAPVSVDTGLGALAALLCGVALLVERRGLAAAVLAVAVALPALAFQPSVPLGPWAATGAASDDTSDDTSDAARGAASGAASGTPRDDTTGASHSPAHDTSAEQGGEPPPQHAFEHPRQPGLLLQAVAPDVAREDRGAPLAERLLGPLDGAWPSSLIFSVGLPGLLLALLGGWSARGRSAWVGRALALLGLALVLAPHGMLPPSLPPLALPLLVTGLALLAGGGLAALGEARTVDPAMVLSWVAVALAAGLALPALQAGAATDVEAIQPWMGADAPTSPAAAAHLAAALRAVLDRAALSAFVAMTAVLGILRYRGKLALSLFLAVAALDAARPWWAP